MDRARHEKAQEALKKAADAIVNKNMKIWVFPEGTRNADHKLLPFKKGAFNIAVFAQIPIIPVVISDYKPFYSKGEKYFHSNGEIVVQVLDPVSTKGVSHFTKRPVPIASTAYAHALVFALAESGRRPGASRSHSR